MGATGDGRGLPEMLDQCRLGVPVALLDRQDDGLELAGMWFLKKSFGPIWRVVQVRVRAAPKAPEIPKEYLFSDEPEEPEDEDPADYLD